jgi:hypothetical protein
VPPISRRCAVTVIRHAEEDRQDARAAFAAPAPAKGPKPNAPNATDEPRVLPQPCPCCGGRMIIIETFARGCKPKHQPTIQEIRIDTS